jgi:hypothetical protein
MQDRPTRATFAAHLSETFRIVLDTSETLDVELIEVTPLGSPAAAPSGAPEAEGSPEPYSLLFRGPPDRPLDQGTYRLEHPVMGRLDLFLVPVGPDRKGLRYEAVFN